MAALLGLRVDDSVMRVEASEAQKGEACGEVLNVLHGPKQLQCKREVQAASDQARSYRHGVLRKKLPELLQQQTQKLQKLTQFGAAVCVSSRLTNNSCTYMQAALHSLGQ